jgi:hypothetical protein
MIFLKSTESWVSKPICRGCMDRPASFCVRWVGHTVWFVHAASIEPE